MDKISKEEIKILYSTASSAGFVDNSNHYEDVFHQIVYGLTGKQSVKELTHQEYVKVKIRLEELTTDTPNGMITIKQKRKVYAMMKELSKLSPSEKSNDERLCGIIRKNLKITSFPAEPLRWVRKKEVIKLIQILGYYIDNEKKKTKKGDAEDGGYG